MLRFLWRWCHFEIIL